MNDKKLLEYGVASSSQIISEANETNTPIEKMARGFTYTTRDDKFPSMPLTFDGNPFNNDILSAKNVLEIGCGVGRNLPWIYENTNALYWGIDPNQTMLDNFWKVTDKKYSDRARLFPSFDGLPEGLTFDVVVIVYVFQHLGYSAPDGAMNVTDITQEIMKHTRKGTIWFAFEHERETDWMDRWFDENSIEPDVLELNCTWFPELIHRGADAHLIIWKETGRKT